MGNNRKRGQNCGERIRDGGDCTEDGFTFVQKGLGHIRKAYIASIHYLQQIIGMQSSYSQEFEPFVILHNHRKTSHNSTHSKQHKRQPKDYSSLPHSIILTRKMAAELELKQKQSQREAEEQERRLAQEYASAQQSEDSRDFFEECSLSRGIPVEEVEQDEAVFSVNEPSPTSNYSKLQRTLFGLGLPEWQDEAGEIRL